VAWIAALALVLSSAGLGALVAVAVHDDATTRRVADIIDPGSNNNRSGNRRGGASTTSGIDIEAIADRLTPAIVNINTTVGSGRAAGTGMILTPDGLILSNNHVIADSSTVKVTIGGRGDALDAEVIGYSVTEDVALLQITDDVSNLPTVTIGDADTVRVGDPIVAIGNALGRGGVPPARAGKVTALDQDVTASGGGRQETLHNMIQVDAAIRPGDSGGPLIDRDGRVIGMNTAAAGGQFRIQSGTNAAFAIRINHAMDIVDQIRRGEESETVHVGPRALLGVQVVDLDEASSQPIDPAVIAPVDEGALVVGVQDKTGAADAQIEAGDVIVSVDGKEVDSSDALHLALTVYHPGDRVEVVWIGADGQSSTQTIELVEGPPA
jgi:S1-C subfamily serine protease